MELSYAKVTCSRHDVPSCEEAFRIHRALYLFEIFSHIFGKPSHDAAFGEFFEYCPPWEIEEFFRVYQFFKHQFNAYADSGLRSRYSGRVQMGHIKRDSPTTTSSVSTAHTYLFWGLERALTIFHQSTIKLPDRFDIHYLPESVLRDINVRQNIHDLREGLLPDFRRAFDQHDESGPSLCWRWMHDQRDGYILEEDEWFRD
jgi:hypothetical protein